MNIKVNARHMDITQAMRDYASEKAEKLQRYFNRITSIELVMDTEAGVPFVEVVVNASRNNTFIASHRGEDMYGCVDNALHKVEQQIRRHKDRVRDHQGPTHGEVGAVGAAGAAGAEGAEDVAREDVASDEE